MRQQLGIGGHGAGPRGKGAARTPALQDQNGRRESDCLNAEQTGRGILFPLGKNGSLAIWDNGRQGGGDTVYVSNPCRQKGICLDLNI